MLNVLVAKEVDLRGTFRFDEEFDWAVDVIARGRIDPSPLLTDVDAGARRRRGPSSSRPTARGR